LIGGTIAAAIAVLFAFASGTVVGFLAAGLAFAIGWAAMRFLIHIGDVRVRPAGTPVPSAGSVNLVAGLGVGFWLAASALAEASAPGVGKDVVGEAFLGFFAGLMFGLRFSPFGRTRL
jgi:hypothetical protein